MAKDPWLITVNYRTGEITRHGVETGKTTLVKENGSYIVWHTAGHMYWSGIGSRNYADTKFSVHKIIEKKVTSNDEADLIVEGLFGEIEWPARWRALNRERDNG